MSSVTRCTQVTNTILSKHFLLNSSHTFRSNYRDLKPENVVFFEKLGVVKLTDFGFSNKFCPGQKLETSCGSLAYSAPEILLGDSYDAPAVGKITTIFHIYIYIYSKKGRVNVCLFLHCRRLVARRYTVYAGVWPSTVSGGQRFGNTNNDNGL